MRLFVMFFAIVLLGSTVAAHAISIPVTTHVAEEAQSVIVQVRGKCVICNATPTKRRHCSVGGLVGDVACAPLCVAMGCTSCTIKKGNC